MRTATENLPKEALDLKNIKIGWVIAILLVGLIWGSWLVPGWTVTGVHVASSGIVGVTSLVRVATDPSELPGEDGGCGDTRCERHHFLLYDYVEILLPIRPITPTVERVYRDRDTVHIVVFYDKTKPMTTGENRPDAYHFKIDMKVRKGFTIGRRVVVEVVDSPGGR
jgi:hypothetical protein